MRPHYQGSHHCWALPLFPLPPPAAWGLLPLVISCLHGRPCSQGHPTPPHWGVFCRGKRTSCQAGQLECPHWIPLPLRPHSCTATSRARCTPLHHHTPQQPPRPGFSPTPPLRSPVRLISRPLEPFHPPSSSHDPLCAAAALLLCLDLLPPPR